MHIHTHARAQEKIYVFLIIFFSFYSAYEAKMQKLRNRNDKRPKMVSSWRVDPEVRCAAILFFFMLLHSLSYC